MLRLVDCGGHAGTINLTVNAKGDVFQRPLAQQIKTITAANHCPQLIMTFKCVSFVDANYKYVPLLHLWDSTASHLWCLCCISHVVGT